MGSNLNITSSRRNSSRRGTNSRMHRQRSLCSND